MTSIGLLFIDECRYFYLYDNSKQKKRDDLTFEQILTHMYDAKLRYSKTNTISCINKLKSKNVHDINKYMAMSIQLRQYYLSENFCKKISQN